MYVLIHIHSSVTIVNMVANVSVCERVPRFIILVYRSADVKRVVISGWYWASR
jgi:hypothetical protein